MELADYHITGRMYPAFIACGFFAHLLHVFCANVWLTWTDTPDYWRVRYIKRILPLVFLVLVPYVQVVFFYIAILVAFYRLWQGWKALPAYNAKYPHRRI